MSKSSRKTQIFQHYNEATGNKYVCIYCGWKTVRNATRMVMHLRNRCVSCPSKTVKLFNSRIFQAWQPAKQMHSDDVAPKDVVSAPSNGNEDGNIHFQIEERDDECVAVHQSPMNVNEDADEGNITPNIAYHLDAAFARAVFASGLPVNAINNPVLLEFFDLLQPNWQPPTTEDVINLHLPQEYCAVKELLTDQIKGESTFSCRGLFDKKILKVYTNSGDNPIFLKELNIEKCRTLDDKCSLLAEIIKQHSPSNVRIIIFDDIKQVPLVRLSLNQIENVELFGCFSKAIKVIALEVNNHFLIVQMEKHIKDIPNMRLKNLLNKENHVNLFDLSPDVLTEIQKYGKNSLSEFWINTNNLINVHIVIGKCNDEMRSELFSIGTVCKMFNSIKEVVCNFETNYDKQNTFLSTLVDECIKSCVTDIHLAANVLDPKRLGADLNASQKIRAMEAIYKLATQLDDVDQDIVMAELAMFNSKSGFFNSAYLWKTCNMVSSLVWWMGYCGQTHQISKVAECVFSISTIVITESDVTTFELNDVQKNQLDFLNVNLKFLDINKSKNDEVNKCGSTPKMENDYSDDEYIELEYLNDD